MEPLSGDLEKSQPSTSQWFKANRHQMHLYQDSKILSRFHNRLGAAKTPTRMDHLVPCSSLASFVPPTIRPQLSIFYHSRSPLYFRIIAIQSFFPKPSQPKFPDLVPHTNIRVSHYVPQRLLDNGERWRQRYLDARSVFFFIFFFRSREWKERKKVV